jgi:hypothetical protein
MHRNYPHVNNNLFVVGTFLFERTNLFVVGAFLFERTNLFVVGAFLFERTNLFVVGAMHFFRLVLFERTNHCSTRSPRNRASVNWLLYEWFQRKTVKQMSKR